MSKKCVSYVLTMVLVLASSAPAVVGPDGIYPIARYEFEGSYEDTTGNGNTGAALGDAAIMNLIPPLPQTGMLTLDGDDDAVALSGLSPVTEITVAMWVNSSRDLSTTSYAGGFCTDWIPGGVHFKFRVGIVNVGIASVGGDVVGTTLLPANEWHHIAFTASASEIAVYYDGVKEGSQVPDSFPALLRLDANPTIGAWNRNGDLQREWNGLKDDFRIYDVALSEAQVRQLVPEPMTLTLLGLGGLGLVRRRR